MKYPWESWYLSALIVAMAWFVWPGVISFPAMEGKWILFHLTGPVTLIYFFVNGLRFPAVPLKIAILLAAALVGMLVHSLVFNPVDFWAPFVDRATVFLFALFCWDGFRRGRIQPAQLGLAAAVAVGSTGIYCLYQLFTFVKPATLDTPYHEVAATFGHTNNMAQFAALAMLMVLPFLREYPRKVFWACLGALAVGALVLVLLSARSVQIGFAASALVTAYFFWSGYRPQLSRRRLAYVGAGLAVFVGVAGWLFLEFGMSKSSIYTYRAELWKCTAKMIAANPLGVGVGRFVFQFVPFHRESGTFTDSVVAASPHNEYLRFVAEEGLPLALLYAAIWLCLFVAWKRSKFPRAAVIAPIGVFLMSEMLFQFPWELPFPSMVAAMFTGWLVALSVEGELEWRAPWAKGLIVVMLVLVVGITVRADLSKAWVYHDDLDRVEQACKLQPSNWRSCLNAARRHIKNNKLFSARVIVESELAREPNNYQAVRQLSHIAFLSKNQLEGCFYLWTYHDMLGGKSSLKEHLGQNCPQKWLMYFEKKRPKRYYHRQRPKIKTIAPPNSSG